MDWKKLGRKIADVAPILGTAVGGPAGAAIGALISKNLGTKDDPESVYQHLMATDEWQFKVLEIEKNYKVEIQRLDLEARKAELQAESNTITHVNQTMQKEAVSEHWSQYTWRPFWGFASGVAFFVVCIFFCVLAYQAVFQGNNQAMQMIPELVTSFTGLFTIAGAVLGITTYFRGKEKVARVEHGQ